MTIGADDVQKTGFDLYPNPVSDLLNIDLDKLPETSITIEVLDINGRLVYRAEHELEIPEIQLDLNSMNLPSGLYLMNVRTGDEVMSKRFVKE